MVYGSNSHDRRLFGRSRPPGGEVLAAVGRHDDGVLVADTQLALGITCAPTRIAPRGRCVAAQASSRATAKAPFSSASLRGGRAATKVVSLRLEHQGEKVTAYGRHAGKTLLWTNDHFCREPEHLAVNRRANHGRHVVILGDERAGDDDIEAGLAPALRRPLRSAVYLTAGHGSACSATSEAA